MRIIDEKGRILGKWNIIDFLVLLFCLCLVPMGFFAHKIMTRPQIVEEKPPTIQLDKAEYEQEQARLEKLDIWLEEHKRARKYFE